ncbi:uncharacterized protein LOC129598621 [Paramacrobiotus metropolitanus]|uniref:uncharacterized protein LOC129598621 n=1 Tax=Paramacrobiotus metropolitanus TaxID=2943436 RepID=UPI002445DD9A|nr:uncharacterized protein LOC129598621 [Paramacrobiotus metropolitanus]XP_055352581.1 uncharacterized protein LOC129598621 [Paramacrobiotus metropolitanus]XP_055352582.1 uncharacterized protein LOC129598621 [Paramacrobiotus metropolitanus]
MTRLGGGRRDPDYAAAVVQWRTPGTDEAHTQIVPLERLDRAVPTERSEPVQPGMLGAASVALETGLPALSPAAAAVLIPMTNDHFSSRRWMCVGELRNGRSSMVMSAADCRTGDDANARFLMCTWVIRERYGIIITFERHNATARAPATAVTPDAEVSIPQKMCPKFQPYLLEAVGVTTSWKTT